jgi:hypothetical protein
MNTRKTVYNKLFKEETKLATHEVELGLLDDLNSLNNQGEGLRQGINKLYTLRSEMISYTKDERNKLVKYLGAAEKLMLNAENKAKELGINLNDNAAYKSSKSRLVEINNVNKIYADFLSSGTLK